MLVSSLLSPAGNEALIVLAILSDEDTRAKMAPFVNVAGAEGVFHLCI